MLARAHPDRGLHSFVQPPASPDALSQLVFPTGVVSIVCACDMNVEEFSSVVSCRHLIPHS